MNSVELENKYQSLIDRIELIKKKPLIISNTVNMLNQMKEFILKKEAPTLSPSMFMNNNLKILMN